MLTRCQRDPAAPLGCELSVLTFALILENEETHFPRTRRGSFRPLIDFSRAATLAPRRPKRLIRRSRVLFSEPLNLFDTRNYAAPFQGLIKASL